MTVGELRKILEKMDPGKSVNMMISLGGTNVACAPLRKVIYDEKDPNVFLIEDSLVKLAEGLKQ